jgi:archaellum component FlaC
MENNESFQALQQYLDVMANIVNEAIESDDDEEIEVEVPEELLKAIDTKFEEVEETTAEINDSVEVLTATLEQIVSRLENLERTLSVRKSALVEESYAPRQRVVKATSDSLESLFRGLGRNGGEVVLQ